MTISQIFLYIQSVLVIISIFLGEIERFSILIENMDRKMTKYIENKYIR